jgi:cytochrome c
MMTSFTRKVLHRTLILLAETVITTGIIAHSASLAWAHGQEQHAEAAGHGQEHAQAYDGHMTTMTAFTDSVPEEYRIMERTPVIDSQESLLAGRKLYMIHCAVCHGSQGRGDGPGAAGLPTPPADFLDFAHSAHYRPGEKYWLIAKGNGTLGMPAHPQLAPRDIWNVVNYILALQAKVKSEGYDSPPHKH